MNRTSLRTIALLAAACFVGAVGAATLISPASATHQPADKVVASGSKLAVLGPNQMAVLLTSTLRSSSPSDLILSVTLECSIFTQLTTGGEDVGPGESDSATASGTVRVWVEVDGQIVPINSDGVDNSGDDTDKVTFCNRVYSREVTDNEQTLLQPDGDGQDIEDDYIRTKDANAFNWLRLNLGSGVHSIIVKGELTQETQGDATAEAAIGSRTLVVEPAKLANDAVV